MKKIAHNKLGFALVVVSLLFIFFQNCSNFEPIQVLSNGSFSSQEECSSILKKSFDDFVYPFFTTNTCVNCHRLDTSHPFASVDKDLAFKTFNQLGADRISEIIRGGHKGNSYSDLAAGLELIQSKTNEANASYIECTERSDDDVEEPGERVTSGELLNVFSEKRSKLCRLDYHLDVDVTEPVTLVWDLEKDFGLDFEGVVFSLDLNLETIKFVCTDEELCDEHFYCVNKFYVTNPQLFSGKHNIQVKNLTVLANNNDFSMTTFSHIDTNVEPNEGFTMLVPSGAAGLIEANGEVLFSNETLWQLKFEKLINTDTL